jgi:hypothetical protein
MLFSILSSLVFFACSCGDASHVKVPPQELSNSSPSIEISTTEDEAQVTPTSSEQE